MNWFLVLKWLHVLAAITAVGSNFTYGVWSAIAEREPEHLGFALRGIKFVDDRVANPAYGVVLVTGLIMAFTTYSITRTWILIGLAGYIILAVVAIVGITPALRTAIAAVESGGTDSPAYSAASARMRGIGLFLSVVVVFVVFDMVFKPQF